MSHPPNAVQDTVSIGSTTGLGQPSGPAQPPAPPPAPPPAQPLATAPPPGISNIPDPRGQRAAAVAPDLGRLYEALRDPLGRYVQRMVKDSAQAQDIVHDIFLQLHAKADQLARVDNIEAWMYRVARNAVIDHVRKQESGWGARADSAASDDEVANLAGAIEDEEGAARESSAALRLASTVRCFIDELPDHYRDALRLTEYEGLDRRALADRQNISLTAAKSRVQRAKRLLMESLQRCCHLEFDRYGTLLDFSPRGQCCPCDPGPTDVTASTTSTTPTAPTASCSGSANTNQNLCQKEDCR